MPTEITYLEAIRQAHFDSMREDSSVLCIGEDIAAFGGAFKVTKGLLEEFGEDRVIDTPIAESGIAGLGIGAAMSGMRPILEMQFASFVSNAFTQLVFNAALAHYRWGQRVPLVVRLPAGGRLSAGPFHSTNPEAWFFHTPGLKLVAPSTPQDAYSLLRASIEDNNPVLFFEHKYLYRRTKEEINPSMKVPIGMARIVKEGSDATIITYGAVVHEALAVCEELEQAGRQVEVIDLRTLKPLDTQTILKSIQKTGRALVIHEAPQTGGIGGEIAALISELAFESLDAPVMRLGAADTPVPFAPVLENTYLPDAKKIAAALKELLNY